MEFTKVTSGYQLMGETNTLLAQPPLPIYPKMSFQFKAVTDGKVQLGYTALAHGAYSGSGYGKYDEAYPPECSSYYVYTCPGEQRLQPITGAVTTPTPSPAFELATLRQQLLELKVVVYYDPNHDTCKAFKAYLDNMGLSDTVQFMDVTSPGVQAQMFGNLQKMETLPYFVSTTTGQTYAGPPLPLHKLVAMLGAPLKESFSQEKGKKHNVNTNRSVPVKAPGGVYHAILKREGCLHCKDVDDLVKKNSALQGVEVIDFDVIQGDPRWKQALQSGFFQATPTLFSYTVDTNGNFQILGTDPMADAHVGNVDANNVPKMAHFMKTKEQEHANMTKSM